MNEKVIHDYLNTKGLNDYAVAGIMGNLYAESALNSKNLQNTYEKSLGMTDDAYTTAVDNGTYKNFVRDSAGYGLAQWTYWSRKQNLLDFAHAQGKSIGDLDMQLDFLWKEMSAYTGMMATLRSATSVREASNAVLLNFERPASMNEPATQDKRAGYGQKYYDQFATTVTTGGGSMKYNDNNKPMVCMQTQSSCYKGTRKMEVKGVLWHSTGANNPWLKRYVQPSDNAADRAKMLEILGKNAYGNDWNHIQRDAGLNCWIGKLADSTVTTIQTMPWDYRPWGCGSGKNGSCNTGWIQFEICEDDLNNADYFNKVYREACEITAYLCKMYNIDPYGKVKVGNVYAPTILCHWDSYELGLGSGHGDVYHWFKKYGKDMNSVRDDVAALMGGQVSSPAPAETVVSYQAKVTADSGLNCRSQSNTNGSILLTYPKDTILSITKEQNGWGYTGTGWVSLAYTEKVVNNGETEDEDMDVKRFGELFSEMRKELQDNDAGKWSEAARQWATSTGLIAGNGTTINGEPNCMWADFLTREQLVTVLYRFAQMMGKA